VVAAVVWKPEIVYGLGEVKVLDVENVDLNITPMDEEDEPPPSFGPADSAPAR
jgi:GntP family gluconate:H+ symporter